MALVDQMLLPEEVRLWQMVDKALPPSLPKRGAIESRSTQGTVCPLQEQSLHQAFLGFGRSAGESPLDLELTPLEQIQLHRGMDHPWSIGHKVSIHQLLAKEVPGRGPTRG